MALRIFVLFVLTPWCAQAFAQVVNETFFGHDLLQIPYASWLIWLCFAAIGIALRYDIESTDLEGKPVVITRQKLRSMVLRGLVAGFIAFGAGELYRAESRPLAGAIQGMSIVLAAMYSRETIAKAAKSAGLNSAEGSKL